MVIFIDPHNVNDAGQMSGVLFHRIGQVDPQQQLGVGEVNFSGRHFLWTVERHHGNTDVFFNGTGKFFRPDADGTLHGSSLLLRQCGTLQ